MDLLRRCKSLRSCVTSHWMGKHLVKVATFVALAALFSGIGNARQTGASQHDQSSSCAAREYRDFDFWLGYWDVADFARPSVVDAHVRVDSILEGCVLHELYEDSGGQKGESFTIYDRTTRTWHQTWVTNRGRLLLLNGGMKDGKMVLNAEDLTSDGKKRLIRGVWTRVPEGVRETAVLSLDDGKTWQPWFDLLFRHHR